MARSKPQVEAVVDGRVPGGDADLALPHDPGLLAVEVEADLLVGLRAVDDLAVLVVAGLAAGAGGQAAGAAVVLGARARRARCRSAGCCDSWLRPLTSVMMSVSPTPGQLL